MTQQPTDPLSPASTPNEPATASPPAPRAQKLGKDDVIVVVSTLVVILAMVLGMWKVIGDFFA